MCVVDDSGVVTDRTDNTSLVLARMRMMERGDCV